MATKRKKNFFYRLTKYFPQYWLNKKTILGKDKPQLLVKALNKAIHNCKAYESYPIINTINDLTKLPVITKDDIKGHELDFVTNKTCKRLLVKSSTGGSTGQPLRLYYNLPTLIKRRIPADYAYSLLGVKELITGMMRGDRPQNGALYEVVDKRHITMSSHHISSETINEYLNIIKTYRINCLHVFPSSIMLMANCIKQNGIKVDLPLLKGIVASSEVLSKDDVKLLKEVFGEKVIVIDYYNNSELSCCAISVDGGEFKFFQNYGYVEFIDTNNTINGHKIAKIVSTSIINSSMPLIRYDTGDCVELDDDGKVISIIGRQTEFLVRKNGELEAALRGYHNEQAYKNVLQFQFYQDEPGKFIIYMVVSSNFSEDDMKLLRDEFNDKFGGILDYEFKIVDSLEKTQAGKLLKVIQKLNVSIN